jgi:hypothetical protein
MKQRRYKIVLRVVSDTSPFVKHVVQMKRELQNQLCTPRALTTMGSTCSTTASSSPAPASRSPALPLRLHGRAPVKTRFVPFPMSAAHVSLAAPAGGGRQAQRRSRRGGRALSPRGRVDRPHGLVRGAIDSLSRSTRTGEGTRRGGGERRRRRCGEPSTSPPQASVSKTAGCAAEGKCLCC